MPPLGGGMEINMIIHTVGSSDTVYSISKQYSVPESRIITDNFLDTTKKLTVGQTLIISRPCKICTVMGGDTLEGIAKRNGVNVMTLLQNNPVLLSEALTPSQTLNVEYEKNGDKSIIVMAYTGSASVGEIEKCLPYVSILNIQNETFINSGEVKLQNGGEKLIRLARNYRALPLLSLDCTSGGGFLGRDTLPAVLESPIATEKFIQSIITLLKQSGAMGIEMLTYMGNTPLKYKLYDLMLALGSLLRDEGYTFSLPYLPDITKDEDAANFNDISDIIPVWSYLWDDEKSGSPACPIDKVEKTFRSPSLFPYLAKSLLGIPTFGTEYSKTATGYRKETVDASKGLLTTHHHPVLTSFDNTLGVPYVNYSDRTRSGEPQKTIYYEDARSYSMKLDLIETFDLAGVNVTSLAYRSPILWQLLNQRFNIIKY